MIERAVLLSTGDELTTGRVVDTNSAYIAQELYALGILVVAVLKVGDDRDKILWALGQAAGLGELIIGTGGLGPTADDLTNETVAAFAGRGLILHRDIVESLKRRAQARGQAWTPNNEKQALLPEGAEVVPNPVGAAPGFRLALNGNKTLFWLPGVPREMEAMLKETVLPWIVKQRGAGEEISTLTFKIYGLTESRLDHALQDIRLPESARLSFRVHYPDLTLRVSVRGSGEREKLTRELAREIRARVGPHIYAETDETLEEIVGRLLLKKGWSLALAESCTGGYLSHRITRVAGSSAYYRGGAVTYSNEAKLTLGVAQATLDEHGPVSAETAREMAVAVRRQAAADVGVSVTGIAGPTGGTAATPVGTVWIGIDHPGGTECRNFHFAGDRERVIAGASQAALYWLRSVLL
ncbi:MAG TPA: competence/damage-inducible protein A [Candidatus Acidoferrales bacterium]|nr:competence/damage-inducible protein A [Candidatus Acidoferrales bacterium]